MDAPKIDLGEKFHWDEVNFSPHDPPKNDIDPPLGILENLVNKTFVGTGFTTTFRPNSVAPTTTDYPKDFLKPLQVAPPQAPNGNVLELNLTQESLAFGRALGRVPNRGFNQQNDIFLNGMPYVQCVNDVTNLQTGKGDGTPSNIHAENGFWLYVPPTETNPVVNQKTLVRMASIPHGTTINAQGLDATQAANAPSISPRHITPFPIGQDVTPTSPDNPANRKASQTVSDDDTARLPQDLTRFNTEGTITQAILDDPASILNSVNAQIDIVETYTFSVSTIDSAATVPLGGGTDNIAFLTGQTGPNGSGAQLDATFWLEIVKAEITYPPYTPGVTKAPLLCKPNYTPPSTGWAAPQPTFAITPLEKTTEPTTMHVKYPQLQYAQRVLLNFDKLSWPHVSVATLVPQDPIVPKF